MYPAEGIHVSISTHLTQKLYQLKRSPHLAPTLPSAAAVVLNPACMLVETGAPALIPSFAEHSQGDAKMLRACKGVSASIHADMLRIVYWTLTHGAILSSTAPLAFTTTLIQNVLAGTPIG